MIPDSTDGKNPGLIVFGLDGATFDVMDRLLDEGEMPFTASLVEKGVRSSLTSTIPPYTPVAWSTFLTGLLPGKHGIFDFLQLDSTGKRLELMNAKRRNGRTLAALLSETGHNPILINVPFTYPPEKIENGCIISGIDAPGKTDDFMYPKDLHDEILRETGPYKLHDYRASGLRSDEYLSVLESVLENRKAVAAYLMRKKPWDFFMVVFSATDHVQHFFWDVTEDKISPQIRKIFRMVDQTMADLFSLAPSGTAVALMSDHGMGPLASRVNINRFLLDRGYLVLKKTPGGNIGGKILEKLKNTVKSALPPSVRDRIRILLPGVESKAETNLAFSGFDWRKTDAFAVGLYGYIYLGKERTPDLVAGIRRDLTSWIPPGLEESPVADVAECWDVCGCDGDNDCPDLIVIWKDWKYVNDQTPPRVKGDYISGPIPVAGSDMSVMAVHRMNGILVLSGSPFGRGPQTQEIPSLVDLAPTFLHALGVPVPSYMDGRVLADFFDESWLAGHPVERSDVEISGRRSIRAGEKDEDVMDRLRGLGYIE